MVIVNVVNVSIIKELLKYYRNKLQKVDGLIVLTCIHRFHRKFENVFTENIHPHIKIWIICHVLYNHVKFFEINVRKIDLQKSLSDAKEDIRLKFTFFELFYRRKKIVYLQANCSCGIKTYGED